MRLLLLLRLALPFLPAAAQQPVAHLQIDAGKIVRQASPRMYGLMTEEINHSYEGGLYAELLSNDTFRGNWMSIAQWGLALKGDAVATSSLDPKDGPSPALPESLELNVASASPASPAGLSNPGYWGIAVRPHTTYTGSFYAEANPAIGPVTIRLIANQTGAVLASTQVALAGAGWRSYSFQLRSGQKASSAENHFELTVAHPGTLHLQLVTLFPPTFDDQPNGNRPDLMEKLAAMHPNFIRLPGGNYLEGNRIEDRFDWEKTIGPLADRPGHQGPWGYWSTDQFGLLEFLEWTQQLHVEPVLAVYAGYSLKGKHVTPGPDLEPYVQSALHEVEYVTGDAHTPWGAQRVRDGHPAPFPLHYIEIGNEDSFDRSGSYPARFAQFAQALRKKYPQYKLIATAPIPQSPAKPGDVPDLLDDHYYKSPEQMFALVHHYDAAPRTGPKVLVGEWATVSATPTPDFGDALGDAAWMTGMERNSDLIKMASYAPLFVNVRNAVWRTNLIGYDALSSYGSPSYYAQCLFAAHMGDAIPQNSLTGLNPSARFFYSVTESRRERLLHLKLVNATTLAHPLQIALQGAGAGAHVATAYSLHGATFEATNTLRNPLAIHPVQSSLHFTGTVLQHTVPALTIEVIDLPLQ